MPDLITRVELTEQQQLALPVGMAVQGMRGRAFSYEEMLAHPAVRGTDNRPLFFDDQDPAVDATGEVLYLDNNGNLSTAESMIMPLSPMASVAEEDAHLIQMRTADTTTRPWGRIFNNTRDGDQGALINLAATYNVYGYEQTVISVWLESWEAWWTCSYLNHNPDRNPLRSMAEALDRPVRRSDLDSYMSGLRYASIPVDRVERIRTAFVASSEASYRNLLDVTVSNTTTAQQRNIADYAVALNLDLNN